MILVRTVSLYDRQGRDREMKNKIILIMMILGAFWWGNSLPCAAKEMETEQGEVSEEQDADEEIYFDADVVKSRTESKSAVADMHGVFVFRRAFIEREKEMKQEQKQQQDNIFATVLKGEQPEAVCKKWITIVLNADTEKYIRDIQKDESDGELLIWISCISLSVCILCIGFVVQDFRKRQEMKK